MSVEDILIVDGSSWAFYAAELNKFYSLGQIRSTQYLQPLLYDVPKKISSPMNHILALRKQIKVFL